ncbi:hypothetical protein TELCIR_20541, partial [Teladorsagia circumcincta]
MPRNVAIYSGFDVLCHALESYTALPYTKTTTKGFCPMASTSSLQRSQGHSYFDADYPPRKALIPHGLSVVTTAVADFEYLTPACPERHAQAARQLGATVS